MTTEEQIIDLVEQYVEQQMTAEEKADFEKRMQEDPHFATEAKAYMQAYRSVDVLIADSLKDKMRQWQVDGHDETKSKRRITWWQMAAAIALLITAGWFLIDRSGAPSLAQMAYTQHKIDYPQNLRGGETAVLPNVQRLLEGGQWAEAIETLEAIPASSEEYAAGQYYLAQASFKQKDYARAEQTLRPLVAQKDLPAGLLDGVEYQLLLTLIAQSKTSEAIQLADQIEQTMNHTYISKARGWKKRLVSDSKE